jgi:hypothetical protein
MGADFPEHKRGSSSGPDFSDVLLVFVVLILTIAWIVGIVMMLHGAATKDLWEFIYGVAMIIVLWIIRTVMKND